MLECTVSFHIHKAQRYGTPVLDMTDPFVEASYMALTMHSLNFDTVEAAPEALF
jgi:hypothetical protein